MTLSGAHSTAATKFHIAAKSLWTADHVLAGAGRTATPTAPRHLDTPSPGWTTATKRVVGVKGCLTASGATDPPGSLSDRRNGDNGISSSTSALSIPAGLRADNDQAGVLAWRSIFPQVNSPRLRVVGNLPRVYRRRGLGWKSPGQLTGTSPALAFIHSTAARRATGAIKRFRQAIPSLELPEGAGQDPG